MPNHVHMVMEVNPIPFSKIIQNLSFRFTRWINKRKNRIGHLFQGRYKAILIDADTYLLGLIRYIHLNPVWSGLSDRPETYHWSGHRSYLELDSVDWLTTDWVLRRFSKQRFKAIEDYTRFITGTTDIDTERSFYSGNQKDLAVLGDESFINQLPDLDNQITKKGLISLEISEISIQVCHCFSITESSLKQRQNSRLAAKCRAYIALIYTENKGSIKDVAIYFNRDPTTLSRQLTTLKQRFLTDKVLQAEIKNMKKIVYAFTQVGPLFWPLSENTAGSLF